MMAKAPLWPDEPCRNTFTQERVTYLTALTPHNHPPTCVHRKVIGYTDLLVTAPDSGASASTISIASASIGSMTKLEQKTLKLLITIKEAAI